MMLANDNETGPFSEASLEGVPTFIDYGEVVEMLATVQANYPDLGANPAWAEMYMQACAKMTAAHAQYVAEGWAE